MAQNFTEKSTPLQLLNVNHEAPSNQPSNRGYVRVSQANMHFTVLVISVQPVIILSLLLCSQNGLLELQSFQADRGFLGKDTFGKWPSRSMLSHPQ